MTDKFYKELKQESKKGIVFQILENGEWKVCSDLSKMPFKNTTLGIHLEGADNFYKEQIKSLQEKLDRQQEQIRLLTDALNKLNGGV